jgi:hypothetical protein
MCLLIPIYFIVILDTYGYLPYSIRNLQSVHHSVVDHDVLLCKVQNQEPILSDKEL